MAELVCGTQDREAWLAARRTGITATDLPVILGLVTWDSPFALYWRKKGKLPEVEQSDRMRLGSWLEVAVATEWGERHGVDVLRKDAVHDSLWRSSARPWQLATPDVMWRGENFTLECKTSATRDGWGGPDPQYEGRIGDAGEHLDPEPPKFSGHFGSKVPAGVRAQVLWQMDTLDVATGHVAVVFLPSGEFRSYTIAHCCCDDDPEVFCLVCESQSGQSSRCAACKDIALMRAEAMEFRFRLQEDDPPPVDGLQVTTDALRHLHAGAVKGKRAEISADLYLTYTGACRNAKEAAEWKHEVENTLRAQMGDATLATFNDQVIARREVFKRAGYTVAPCEVDRLVRVKPKTEDEHDDS